MICPICRQPCHLTQMGSYTGSFDYCRTCFLEIYVKHFTMENIKAPFFIWYDEYAITKEEFLKRKKMKVFL